MWLAPTPSEICNRAAAGVANAVKIVVAIKSLFICNPFLFFQS